MGKTTKPARPKGKAQPASSSRAADLAGAGTGAVDLQNLGGFARFVTPTHGSFAPTSPMSKSGSSEGEVATSHDLSPELVVVIKKLSKRDSITKVRALEEFEAYLKNNESSVISILDVWDRLFGKLALDVDRRVRLATQSVHQFIVSIAKRKIAPHLKSMIGPWLICFFDPSKDVARIAVNSFSSAFPPEKKKEVLVFCQKSIVEYTSEMILEKTADTLSDPRDVTKEEMEAKFARVIIESFHVLAYLINEISVDDRMKVIQDYNNLVDNEKFWKYATDENPYIRKAVYNFLKVILSKWPDMVEPRLPIIRKHFLSKAFAESNPTTHPELWDSLLVLTNEFPQAWVNSEKKPPFPKLLNALRNGLNGSPAIAYPSMLALLANLPKEIIKDHQAYVDVFTSFWTGGLSEHIDRKNASIFINAFVECAIYMAATVSKRIESAEEADKVRSYLIHEQFGKVIKLYFAATSTDRITQKLDPASISLVISKHLISLSSIQSLKDQFELLWSEVESFAVSSIDEAKGDDANMVLPERTSQLLSSMQNVYSNDEAKSTISALVEDLAAKLFATTVGKSLDPEEKSTSQLYLAAKLLASFKSLLFKNPSQADTVFEDVQTLAKGMKQQKLQRMPTLIAFIIQFMAHCNDKSVTQSIFNTIVEDIDFSSGDTIRDSLQLIMLGAICEKASLDAMKAIVCQCPLDKQILMLVQRKLCQKPITSSTVDPKLLQSTIVNAVLAYNVALTPDGWRSVMKELATFMFAGLQSISSNDLEASGVMDTLLTVMSITTSILADQDSVKRLVEDSITAKIVISVFEANFINIDTDDDKNKQQLLTYAETAWQCLLRTIGDNVELQHAIAGRLCEHIRSALMDTGNISSPTDFVKRASMVLSGITSRQPNVQDTIIDRLLLPATDWQALGQSFMHQLPMGVVAFAITDPIAGAIHQTPLDEDEMTPVDYDIYGLSSYGRCILYAHYLARQLGIQLFVEDNGNAKRVGVFFELIAAGQVCHKYLQAHLPFGIWDGSKYESSNEIAFREAVDIGQSMLKELLKQSSQLSLTLEPSAQWLASTDNDSLPNAQRPSVVDRLVQASLAQAAQNSDNLYYAEAFRLICRHALVGTLDDKFAEAWINIVLTSEKEATFYPTTIVDLLKVYFPTSQAVIKFQNRLAGQVSSIKVTDLFDDSDSTAWKTLVLLNQCISNKLPLTMLPPRLVFFMQSLRKWFESDVASEASSYRSSRVRSQYLKLLSHMAPALLNVPGSHWDYILSVIQEWLMLADITIPADTVLVYEALSLFATLKNLADENEDLLSTFSDYNGAIQETIFDILIAEQSTEPTSPRLALHELLAQLLEDVPDKMVKQKSVEDNLLSIIQAPSESFQKASYKLLSTNIVEQAQGLSASLEFSHSEENPSLANFNERLLEQIFNPPDLSGWMDGQFTDKTLHDIFGYLLAWMLLYDHFEDITFKLKSNYVQQLNENSATDKLMNFIFKILGVGFDHTVEPFDLSKWEVNTFDILGFDLSFDFSLQLLASHIYFRSLQKTPSLVRQWWAEIKSRQLSLAVESYTSKYFSSLIINSEIESVVQADAKSLFAEDENFTVKALKAVNEIIAVYRVDDQNIEMAIRLPPMFPLRKVDVNGVQKVGVDEKRWRAWLLAVSAIIVSQNGNLVDALTLFKRNVSMHFEGIEDCTICYSIVSVTDRSLPSKQCRTCKNKYHASCLYKWFSSSNSSSCPLCRTLF